MHYVLASQSFGEQAQLFAQITEAVGGDGRLEIYRDVADFSARLRRRNRPEIMILLLSDGRDLTALDAVREILVEADVILLVSGDAEDTIAAAHSLRPRYLGRIDSDLDRVVSVLRKLLQKRMREYGSTQEVLAGLHDRNSTKDGE